MTLHKDWLTNNANRDWTARAICTTDIDPEIFFPSARGRDGGKRNKERAAAICRQCPVRKACREYVDLAGITDGVWGGEFFSKDTTGF